MLWVHLLPEVHRLMWQCMSQPLLIKSFVCQQVFPLTRKLPGAKTPILNPYRDAAEPFKAADDDE
jgi:hypothetical protein